MNKKAMMGKLLIGILLGVILLFILWLLIDKSGTSTISLLDNLKFW